jgi:hypothetical protein
VNPNQILLSLKKHLEGRRLVSEKTTSSYQQQFRQLACAWATAWAPRLEAALRRTRALGAGPQRQQDQGMTEILRSQWTEANELFSRFVADAITSTG